MDGRLTSPIAPPGCTSRPADLGEADLQTDIDAAGVDGDIEERDRVVAPAREREAAGRRVGAFDAAHFRQARIHAVNGCDDRRFHFAPEPRDIPLVPLAFGECVKVG